MGTFAGVSGVVGFLGGLRQTFLRQTRESHRPLLCRKFSDRGEGGVILLMALLPATFIGAGTLYKMSC